MDINKQALIECYTEKLEAVWKKRNGLLKIEPIPLSSSQELLIGGKKYIFTQCPTLNPMKREDIPVGNHVPGVYVFVVKKDFCLNLVKFFSEVTGMFFGENEILLSDHCFVPPYNGACKDGKHRLKKDHVFYIGSSKDVGARIYEHLTSNTLKSPTSLKLGFKLRGKEKNKLDLYFCEVDKIYRDLEKDIRNQYGSYFGE